MEASVLRIILISMIVGTLSVIIAISLVRLWDSSRKHRIRKWQSRHNGVVFLFDNKKLTDATPAAHHLLAGVGTAQDEWHRLMSWIAPHFPGAIDQIEKLEESKRIDLSEKSRLGNEKFHLSVENLGNNLVRFSLSANHGRYSAGIADGSSQRLMSEELQLLRQAAERTPAIVWREDKKTGEIVWGNTTYLKYVGLIHNGVIDWPLPRFLDPKKPSPDMENTRDKFIVNGTTMWVDCYEHDIGEQKIFYALPADAAVRAERNLRDFVQTLTNTFVGLQSGLAIFDRQRNLQLFNPALVDLTTLPVEYLATRPTLADFLDQLRERRMVPEPKDFRSWQRKIINLEKSSSQGCHLEEWSLPGGQTYRVAGRPQSSGAIAFVFEDITRETVNDRELREAFTLNKLVLDEIDDAVIVFGLSNQPVLANRAYLTIWGEPGDTQAEIIADWRWMVPDTDLAKVEEGLRLAETGQSPSGTFTIKSGDVFDWTISQISGGQIVVTFKPVTGTMSEKAGASETVSDKSATSAQSAKATAS